MDDRERELERAAKSGAPTDRAAWIRHRMRTGLDLKKVELAAYVGEPGARLALGWPEHSLRWGSNYQWQENGQLLLSFMDPGFFGVYMAQVFDFWATLRMLIAAGRSACETLVLAASGRYTDAQLWNRGRTRSDFQPPREHLVALEIAEDWAVCPCAEHERPPLLWTVRDFEPPVGVLVDELGRLESAYWQAPLDLIHARRCPEQCDETACGGTGMRANPAIVKEGIERASHGPLSDVRQRIQAELSAWALDEGDPVRERVRARRIAEKSP